MRTQKYTTETETETTD